MADRWRWTVMVMGMVLAGSTVLAGVYTTVTGVVVDVDWSRPNHPKVTLSVQGSDAAPMEKTYSVPLGTEGKGEIDWGDPEARARGRVLALEPGYRVKLRLNGISTQVRGIELLSLASERGFPGHEKISDSTLLTDLVSERPRKPVLVVLKAGDDLVEKAANPKTRKAALAEIRGLQERVQKAVPESDFRVLAKMENSPVMSGSATLAGIRALAGMAEVAAIEPDLPMETMTPEPGAMSLEPEAMEMETSEEMGMEDKNGKEAAE